jgi:hypothetical protein
MFKRKYSITLLNGTDWSTLQEDLRLTIIPRQNELVYLESLKRYFIVSRVIHYMNKKHGIFLIVNPFTENIKPEIEFL